MNKNTVIGGIVVLLVGLVLGYGLFHKSVVTTQVKGISNLSSINAASSKIGTNCDTEFGTCVGVVTYGGYLATTTTATTETISASDLTGYAMINITPNGGALTVTLPATSTLTSWLPNVGDNTKLIVFNASTTANQTVTFAAGTGTLMEVGSTTGSLIIAPGKAATIDVFRKWNTDLVFLMQNYY